MALVLYNFVSQMNNVGTCVCSAYAAYQYVSSTDIQWTLLGNRISVQHIKIIINVFDFTIIKILQKP